MIQVKNLKSRIRVSRFAVYIKASSFLVIRNDFKKKGSATRVSHS